MKQHSTNYHNTLITLAEDSKTVEGIIPPIKDKGPVIANYQFDLLEAKPLTYTSDDLLFAIFAKRHGIAEADYQNERQQFFSKGQPCLRTSPLCKTYGWGIYHDSDGKIKLVDAASEEYQKLIDNQQVKKTPAMKSKK